MKFRGIRYYRDALDPSRYFSSTLGKPQPASFIFHDVQAATFERRLQFLRDNGYRGVSCSGVDYDAPDPREVILTFDDGRRSLWAIAFPLLQKYGFRATAFVSPGLIVAGPIRPTAARSNGADDATNPLFNWAEARELARSGVIDLQLHGYAHARVFVSPRIVDYERDARSDSDDGIAAWMIRRSGEDHVAAYLSPGEPIYEFGSRWGSERRYLEDDQLCEICTAYVAEHGGSEAFFTRRGWRRELDDVVTEYRKQHAKEDTFETRAQKRSSLASLLKRSRELLEQQTGIVAQHFALPWGRGNELVEEVAAEAGIRHIHWAYLDAKEFQDLQGHDVRHHVRLKEIFLERLRAERRRSLCRLVAEQLVRKAV